MHSATCELISSAAWPCFSSFVDHVPDNVLAKFTLKNFGFADAAEVFVLLAGFSAVLAYQRVFEGQGFKAGVARVFERVRDIYLWHLALVVICGLGLTLAATQFGNISYVTNIGVHVFTENPARSTRACRGRSSTSRTRSTSCRCTSCC